MQIHNLIQGSPEWLTYRAQHFNASDAPAMMGCSPYKTRAALLRELHTGLAPDVDAGTQKRFDNGHRAEALARPLAEGIVGEDLFPVVGSLGRLSASFDGATLDESRLFEHKALNDELRAAFGAMDRMGPHDDAAACRLLPIHHRVQMEQQLHVSGAERVLFMASEWDAAGELVQQRHCWYYPDDELRAEILRGWDQFAIDLAAYVPPAAVEPAPVGKAPETLPALLIQVTGAVTASNLAEFKATALGAIRSVNRELTTDQHFADAERAVKWCGEVESRLAAAKEHALSQTATIDALFKTIDEISAEARRVRLDLDKLITRRKTEVKEEAITAARRALDLHISAVNAEIAPMRIQPAAVDFAGAIKGKRSIDSMQDALDTLLASAKIAADAQGRAIRANVLVFQQRAAGMEALFADLGQLVHKAADDFSAVVDARIAKHLADEIRREQARQAAEAERIAAAERRAAAEAEARVRAEQEAQARREREAAEATDRAAPANTSPGGGPMGAGQPAAAGPAGAAVHRWQPAANEPATLKLSTVCERLGVTVTAAFMADVLHIKAADTAGRAVLYRESQWPVICQQLQAHISAMGELYTPSRAA